MGTTRPSSSLSFQAHGQGLGKSLLYLAFTPALLVPSCPSRAPGSYQVAISSAVYSTRGIGSPLQRGVRSQRGAPRGGRAGGRTGGAWG